MRQQERRRRMPERVEDGDSGVPVSDGQTRPRFESLRQTSGWCRIEHDPTLYPGRYRLACTDAVFLPDKPQAVQGGSELFAPPLPRPLPVFPWDGMGEPGRGGEAVE